jgi:predicted molibdopterin-dependent oxidoreductase YjgC
MGITQHTHGEDGVRQILNLLLLRGFVGREGCGAMPIRGHSGVQGGAEIGCYATAFPGGKPVDPANAAALGAAWGFPVPSAPGLTTPEMIDAAAHGALDVLYAIGGNFIDVLPDPAGVERAITTVPLRVHHDIVLTRQMLMPPAGRGEAVLILPAPTRYEIPGGVTETSTERRIIFSPEIPGPRVPEARHEGQVLLDLARRVRPAYAPHLTFPTMADVRQEIARIVPFYAGIEHLAKAGDQFQYGGPHLCADWRFPTPTGKAHFAALTLPETHVPAGSFRLSTRRGKQFNSLVHDPKDRITGALREAVLMAPGDADRLGLADGTAVELQSPHGRLVGHVHRADIALGNVQVHWPEGNVLLDPARRSPVSRIPDFNATVTLSPVATIGPIAPGPR